MRAQGLRLNSAGQMVLKSLLMWGWALAQAQGGFDTKRSCDDERWDPGLK